MKKLILGFILVAIVLFVAIARENTIVWLCYFVISGIVPGTNYMLNTASMLVVDVVLVIMIRWAYKSLRLSMLARDAKLSLDEKQVRSELELALLQAQISDDQDDALPDSISTEKLELA